MNIEVKTIYLSRDYKKDHKSYREKFLKEWEDRHKSFIDQIKKEESGLEVRIFNRLITIKVEIKDFRVVVTDTISATSSNYKKIGLFINSITSYGCDEKGDSITEQDRRDDKIIRIVKATKIYFNIFDERSEQDEMTSTCKDN